MKVQCSNCRQVLEIDEGLRGQQVRCPKCEYIVQAQFDTSVENRDRNDTKNGDLTDRDVPPHLTTRSVTSAEKTSGTSEAAPPSAWFLRIPEGHEFGPISLSELDKWVIEGRVNTDCRIKSSESEWQPAHEFYPELDGDSESTAAPPRRLIEIQERVPQVLEPHRGAFILTLAFAGCVIPFLSLWPAVIGTRDLQRMSVGKMDLSGEAMTRSGQAIAMVSSMIWFGAFAIGLLTALIRAMGGFSV